MARLVLQVTVGVALLGVMLQYFGLAPSLPGLLGFGSSSSRSSTAPGHVNTGKLLADLNSDIRPQEQQGQPLSGGQQGQTQTQDAQTQQQQQQQQRVTSAALSVMYLATLPGLREQVQQAPGIVESLLRHVVGTDLAAAQQRLIRTQQLRQQQNSQQKQQQQQPGGGGGDAELLPACLLALARLAGGDEPLATRLLGLGAAGGGSGSVGYGHGGGGGGGQGARRAVAKGQLLGRLGELLRSGVPTWQAAAAVLLRALAGGEAATSASSASSSAPSNPSAAPPSPPPPSPAAAAVLGWVGAVADQVVDAGVGLLEAGAHFNSSDALQSGCSLLGLLAEAGPGGRGALGRAHVPPLVMQVIVTFAGTNTSSSSGSSGGSSEVVGAAARVLLRLTGGLASSSGSGGSSSRGAGAAADEDKELAWEVARNVTLNGVIAPLVREVRLGHRASLAPSLALLRDCMAAEEQQPQQQPAEGRGADPRVTQDATRVASHEAVGAGLLSLCAQLLFRAGSDPEARAACSSVVQRLVAANSGEPDDEGDNDRSSIGSSGSGGTRGRSERMEGPPYGDSPEGRAVLASDLVLMMRGTAHPGLHNSVLEAARDAAPARPAAEALVGAGAAEQAARVLTLNASAAFEQGLDAPATAWLLQSQRSAAALLALLALQAPLRPQLVEQGALGGLAAALRQHSGQPGLMAQVRVTAAAALVPLLGDDGRYDEAAVTAGVLEPLVRMHYSRSGPEQQAADRVLALLGRQRPVADMYERVGIKL